MNNCSLIGFGNWGKKIFRNIQLFNELNIKYICKQNLDNLDLINLKINTTNNYKKAINDEIDSVFIVSPSETHYEISKFALINKKNVFVEKPICLMDKQFQELINIAKKNSLILHINYIHLYNENFTDLTERFKSEYENNEKVCLKIILGNNGPIRLNTSPFQDWAPHIFSIMNYVLGMKEYKLVKYKIFLNENNASIYNVYLSFVYKNFIIKTFFGNNFAKKNTTVKILTTNKKYEYYDKYSYIYSEDNYQKLNFQKKTPLEKSIKQFVDSCNGVKIQQLENMSNITSQIERIQNKLNK